MVKLFEVFFLILGEDVCVCVMVEYILVVFVMFYCIKVLYEMFIGIGYLNVCFCIVVLVLYVVGMFLIFLLGISFYGECVCGCG